MADKSVNLEVLIDSKELAIKTRESPGLMASLLEGEILTDLELPVETIPTGIQSENCETTCFHSKPSNCVKVFIYISLP